MSITHNKKQVPLLNLLINCMLGRSEPQMLPIKGECTIRFLNFLIIRLCSSLDNSLFFMISFLTTPPAIVLSKNL